MLKKGIVEGAFSHYGFENGLKKLKAHGIDCMDYQEFINTESSLFEKSDADFEAYLTEQKKQIQNAGITVSQAHGPWRWPPHDETPEIREKRLAEVIRSIRGTALLGCENFVIHPIMPFGINDISHEKETHELNLEFMSRLCDAGREYGVTVCLENMPMPELSIATPEQILSFVKEINDEHFKVCLDTGHCAVCKVSAADAVRMIGKDYLRVLHIHDNNGENDLHWRVFEGVIDWTGFGRALGGIGFDGTLSLETGVAPDIPENLYAQREKELFAGLDYIYRIVEINRTGERE